MNKELTKAEEQVMQAVWKVGQGFASDIVAAVDSDAAYNTVLTVVRTLEQKGFVGHETSTAPTATTPSSAARSTCSNNWAT